MTSNGWDRCLSGPGRARRRYQTPAYLELMEREAPGRAAAEAFIAKVFRRAYGAEVSQFLPRLMVLSDAQRQPVAALGMRSAAHAALFLEAYLDAPIETTIAQALNEPVSRAGIIEVGNLASEHRGGLRCLIAALTAYLRGARAEWVVFTAVPAVLNAFARLGLEVHVLAVADKRRLGGAQHDWGRYYDAGPVVVAGRVAHGYRALADLFHLEHTMDFQI